MKIVVNRKYTKSKLTQSNYEAVNVQQGEVLFGFEYDFNGRAVRQVSVFISDSSIPLLNKIIWESLLEFTFFFFFISNLFF